MRSLSDLLMIFGLFLLFLALGQAVILVTLALWYGVPMNGDTIKQLFDIQQLLKHPEGVWAIFYTNGLLSIFSMLLSGWVYRLFFASKPVDVIQKKTFNLPTAGVVILLMLVLLPLITWLVWLNNQIDLSIISADLAKEVKDKEAGTKLMIRLLTTFPTIWHFWVATLVMCITPALVEEFWFRGILQNKLLHLASPHVAIWLTGFIFSVFHFQFEGFLARWLLGALFGYLYFWSGNLWATIIAHFVNNFATLTAFYLFNHKYISYDFYNPTPFAWYLIVLSLIATSGLIYFFKKTVSLQTPQT